MGIVNYNGGVQLITEPTFVKALNVTGAGFDGTDTANVADAMKTQEANNSKFNPWKKNGGFRIKPTADGTTKVLTWEAYERNGKVVDDALSVEITTPGGEWEPTKVIKVYDADTTVKTIQIGTVL